MLVEVVVGALAHSLALLSHAAHMLTDAGAIALALVAARLAQHRAQDAMTYGLRRAEILSARANGLTLIILAALTPAARSSFRARQRWLPSSCADARPDEEQAAGAGA